MYRAKDFKPLLGTAGFSDGLLTNHFALYQGYVDNVNKLNDLLPTLAAGSPLFAEVKRRFGWEFNGMRLHELYFEGMKKGGASLDTRSKLAAGLQAEFGSVEAWAEAFKATGASRGIGWAMLIHDPRADRLFNIWVNEHDVGVLAGCRPLLTLDVFEHAYMNDYGLKKAGYIDAFMAAVDWRGVEAAYDAV